MLDRTSLDSSTLLLRLNKAVAAANEAQDELVSRSKAVGLLLLEARRLHPGVSFEAFLKKVNGLKRSRAYDLMALAGGRTTDEELKKDARERQQRSRDKKKRIPEPKPEPISVTSRKDDEKRKPAVQESFDSPQEAHGPAASPEDPKIGPSNLRNIFLMNCAASVQVARYEGPVDKEIRAAARRTAEAWKQLADEMERSGGGGP